MLQIRVSENCQRKIEELIQLGVYSSAEQVVEQAIENIQVPGEFADRSSEQIRLARLAEKIQAATQQADSGQTERLNPGGLTREFRQRANGKNCFSDFRRRFEHC